ncbi:MAG: hypothetical protein ACM3SY_17580 [Candidatus Omnitrophota bacterium]
MSDQKLNLSHKVFAALERLVKDTVVWDAELTIPATCCDQELSLPQTCVAIDPAIPSAVVDLEESSLCIRAETQEIVDHLIHPTITDARMNALEAVVHDEPVGDIASATIHEVPLDLETSSELRVHDFFKKYRIAPTLSYTATVKPIDIESLKAPVHGIAVNLASRCFIRENVTFFHRLTVQHKPAVLSFLSERTQLGYWKRAVVQTKKEARKLDLIGIYWGVPYESIENIKINYSQKRLCYHFKAQALHSDIALKNIALFVDTDTQKTVVVMPNE